MNKEVAKKWVAALRSGQYKQGKNRLQDANTFCCLGVLCAIAPVKYQVEGRIVGNTIWQQTKVFEWSGMSYKSTLIVTLMDMNDRQNKSFKEIADVIEARQGEL